ncbi:ATP-binding protein [Luteimonas composti]|uniref:histidine kinase n=1 Tax=Luteimonas composti TaxID=398257 RepID=A0ABT6MT57_9GAMM|nr:ATP-binding protein [Luteimonas composti]MDH7453826.1 ATP-binding protein [Luteimonas composti]
MDAAGSHEANRNVISQANFRLSFGVLVAVTIACVHWFGSSRPDVGDGLVVGMLSGYIGYAAFARWLAARPERLANRDLVVITAVIDPLILSAWMYFAGGSSMVFVAFYLFTTLGFGFRVGTMPMHICQAFSLVGFGMVVMTSPLWRDNLLFAASHALLLVVVPLYAASLVRRINAAREAAEFDSRAKSQLLAKVSHELRTPLTGIVADAQLLEVEAVDAGTVNRARSIQRLATTLDSEIKQLLDLSKIAVHGGDSRLAPEPFSLAFTATQVVGSIRSIVGAKPLAVELDFDERIKLPVVGRHQELVSILTNLAGNAVKFTEQGAVTLQIALVETSEEGYRVRFAVSDTGIGIDPAYHEKIFQPFFQVESGPARRYGGTGLGISIASELVRRMGGRLQVDSKPGQGSTFFFELVLPVDASPAAETALAETTPSAVAGKRVLVADDNATNLSLLREMLLKDGHQVTAVESGHEAILMLSANTYDVIFLDYNMDDVNGAVVYQTYAYSRVQLAPTFFITADTTAMTTRLLEDLGANGVIYKPLTFEKIRAAIASVFPDEARPVAEPARPRPGGPVALSGVPVEYLDPTAIEELREIKDSPEFLHAVVADGIADIHALHQAMAEAIDGSDLPGLHKHSHAMKGVALSLGAVRLAHLADRLMTMTHDTLTGNADRWHEDLDVCVAKSCQSLDDLRLAFATQAAVNT